MHRIAIIATVAGMVVAPAAMAKPIDLRSPDAQVAHTALATQVDLRSPDAIHGFVAPSATPRAADTSDGDLSSWALLAIVAAALGACGVLAVMLRRHLAVGRPVGV